MNLATMIHLVSFFFAAAAARGEVKGDQMVRHQIRWAELQCTVFSNLWTLQTRGGHDSRLRQVLAWGVGGWVRDT
jgi:hypothetical protein